MGYRTIVVIPTFNERNNVRPLLSRILSLDPWIEVLVIDDASPDGTGEVVEECAVTMPRLHVIHRAGKMGLGTAYVEGFQYALDHGFDFVIEMDADFSHRPEDIPRLLAAAREADVVVGSRNVPGGRVIGWSPLRHIVSRAGSLYARLLLGLPIHDCTAGFKCFRRSALESFDVSSVQSRGYAFQVEMNFACAQAGLRMMEIPVVFPDRTEGRSKMTASIAAEAAVVVLRLAAVEAGRPLARRLGWGGRRHTSGARVDIRSDR